MARGRFITFEGGEGSGKSTQASLLAERLRASGVEAVLTREPGGSPFAEQVRAVIMSDRTPAHGALSEALLFHAARADHLDKTIRPALAAGQWVISDRFADSTRVYQGFAGGLDGTTIDRLERLVVGDDVPDLTLIIDIDPSLGLARARARRSPIRDAYEARELEFHAQLRKGFLQLPGLYPERCVGLDGDRSVEEVSRAVWSVVESRLFGRNP